MRAMTGECIDTEKNMQASAGSNVGVILGDRYLVVRVLKMGRHIETVLATDTTCDAAVVVKLVAEQSISPDVQHQLEHDRVVYAGQ